MGWARLVLSALAWVIGYVVFVLASATKRCPGCRKTPGPCMRCGGHRRVPRFAARLIHRSAHSARQRAAAWLHERRVNG
jgi:hypothetical protein